MTEKLIERFDTNSTGYRVLTFVVGGLLFEQGQNGTNPLKRGVNVEDLFNAVQLLAERHDLEAAPFVGSWHRMVDELDRKTSTMHAGSISRTIFRAIWKEIAEAIPHHSSGFEEHKVNHAITEIVKGITKYGRYTSGGYGSVGHAIGEHIQSYLNDWGRNLQNRTSGNRAIDQAFEQTIDGQREIPGEGEIFANTAREMIGALRDLVWVDSEARVAYLKPIFNLLLDQPRLVIATLNYDNSIELAAKSAGAPCMTGIANWATTQALECPDDGLVLLKLHGSIDWRFRREPNTPLPVDLIEQVPATEVTTNHQPAVIFGQKNKLTAQGPFLDIFRHFKLALDQATRLTVIGYSFADVHVNEYVARWLNGAVDRSMRIVDPGFEDNPNPFAASLRQGCKTRMEVLARPAEDVLAELCQAGQAGISY
jgi:hypothetical protein